MAHRAWTEVSPGVFHRRIDCLERMAHNFGQAGNAINKDHMAVTVSAKVEFDCEDAITKQRLRHAWRGLRYQNPDIACTFDWDKDVKIYEVPDETTVREWVLDTFKINETYGGIEKIHKDTKTLDFPTLYYLPNTTEVVIDGPRTFMDGPGAQMILDRLFSAIVDPREVSFGEEVVRLSPAFEESFSLPFAEEDSPNPLLDEYLKNLPGMGLEANSPNDGLKPSAREAIELSTDETRHVVTRTKALGVGMAEIFHAAVAEVLRIRAKPKSRLRHPETADHNANTSNSTNNNERNDKNNTKPDTTSLHRLTSLGFFNCRPYTPDALKSTSITSCTVVVPFTFTPRVSSLSSSSITIDPLTSSTHFFQSFYHSEDPLTLPFDLKSQSSWLVNGSKLITLPRPATAPPSPSEPHVLSLGIIEERIKHSYSNTLTAITLKVLDFDFGVQSMASSPMIHHWTWRGKFKFAMSYNPSFYDEGYVLGFLRQVRNVLVGESHGMVFGEFVEGL